MELLFCVGVLWERRVSLPDPSTCPIGTAHVRDGPPYWTTTYGNFNRTLDTVAFGKAEKELIEIIVITT